LVKLKLTPNSSIAKLKVTPTQEITREKEIEVSVAFAINRIGDPNYLFTFEECDRSDLESADEKLLASASIGLRKEVTAKELVETLLPKKKVVPKKTTPKKTTRKTTTKSSLTTE
jgi:hypothetical protein|tara:strand:+ start:63 stop:407 length:345 start_codon:yes stop_codon:yes gene_type:complete